MPPRMHHVSRVGRARACDSPPISRIAGCMSRTGPYCNSGGSASRPLRDLVPDLEGRQRLDVLADLAPCLPSGAL